MTKKVLVVISSVLLASFTWELIIRNFIWRQPWFNVFPKGVVARPVSVSVRSQEGWSKRVHVNEFGTFHPIRKDVPVIVFQGDSYTYAEQVAVESNYSSLVRKTVSDNYEILNAGNFGMNVSHYVYNERYFREYNPHYHIIQVKYDDFFDSLASNEALHFIPKGDSLDFGFHETNIVKWVNHHLEFYNYLNQVSFLSYFRDKYLQDINRWIKSLGQPAVKKEPDQLPKYLQKVAEKTKTNEEVLKLAREKRDNNIRLQLRKLKEVYGERFALLYLPRNPSMRDLRLILEDPNEREFNEIILRLSKEQGIPVISMWQPFIELYNKKKILSSGYFNTIPGFGHLNVHGHDLVADELIKFIRTEMPK